MSILEVLSYLVFFVGVLIASSDTPNMQAFLVSKAMALVLFGVSIMLFIESKKGGKK